MELVLSFNWLSILLLVFTFFMVEKDRAFSRVVRAEFRVSMVLCLCLYVASQYLSLVAYGKGLENVVYVVHGTELIVRPAILLLLIYTTEMFRKNINYLLCIPLVVNIPLVLANITIASTIVFYLYLVIFVTSLVCIAKRKNGEFVDYFFAAILVILGVSAAGAEVVLNNTNIINYSLSVMTCVYYFYMVMRIFKKDSLTGLLIRHNLNYEMADLHDKEYHIVLIDVDNFKLINDKYGHDKGDEALVNVVECVKKHLLKGCRLFRFGGDEFVIISKRVSMDELIASLDNTNAELANIDLHISFGVVKHMPGDSAAVKLTEADKKMYENKRMLKSEDIWDDMTGLYNYRGFLDEIGTFIKTVEKDNHVACLIAVDVECLNNINMAYGYTEGNLVIATLARVLKTCLSGRDFLGHLGSDEFAAAIECDDANDDRIGEFIVQLQEGLDAAYEFANKDYNIKLNFGKYVITPGTELSSEDVVNNVLYIKQEDKENRRKNDTNDANQEYNNQDEELVLEILDDNKLKYAFQPIVSAKDGEIVAYEALMRSDTATKISPLKILKYAERNKRVYEVEKYTFFNVLKRVRECGKFEGNERKIFINSIPGFSLNDTDYAALKTKYGDLLERMVVEITEQREIDDETLAMINSRRDDGKYNLAIDDYGSGCSNTNSLLRYMPQVVKLDRLLITGIDRNAKKQFFVDSLVSFARDNDMVTLAEGVETESELKTVIRLGVDLIQGYYTAKPNFNVIDEIQPKVKKIIVDENIKAGSNKRRVYTASSNCDLSAVHLAMEDYYKVNISAEWVTINGSTEYTADMSIKIMDGITCNLNISDLKLNSIDDEPCIALGENSHLNLFIEGNNRFNAKGIYVPEGSSLTISGPGNLNIYAKGHLCYAIGADSESPYGKLIFKNSGHLIVNVDGEECVGIGGGIATENSLIEIAAGSYELNFAGVNAVGIGSFEGKCNLNITDCEITSSFRVNTGVIIGTRAGTIAANIKNFNFDLKGSGTDISGIGSIGEITGKFLVHSGTYKCRLNGHNIYLLGAPSGEMGIEIIHARLETTGEGDNVLGFGTVSNQGKIRLHECSMDSVINAANPKAVGASVKEIVFGGPLAYMQVNGVMENIAE